MAARPRRSTASTSYAHLLAPLNLTSSSSSSSSDDQHDSATRPADPQGTSQGPDKPKTKPKKKRKPVYIPDDSSGSEFELPDKHAGAPGGAAPDDDDDDDDDDSAPDSALDSDDLDDGASISGASGLSGSIVGASPPPGGGRRGAGGRGRGKGKGRGARAGVGAGRAAGRASVVVAAGAVAQRTGSAAGGVAPPRARPSDMHPASALGVQHPWIGPLAALAPSIPLEGSGKRGTPKSFAAGRAGEPGVLRDGDVHELLEMHSGNPFGVDKAWVRDMDYVPGRYAGGEDGREELRERERWGGWYDELEVQDIIGVSSQCVPFPYVVLTSASLTLRRPQRPLALPPSPSLPDRPPLDHLHPVRPPPRQQRSRRRRRRDRRRRVARARPVLRPAHPAGRVPGVDRAEHLAGSRFGDSEGHVERGRRAHQGLVRWDRRERDRGAGARAGEVRDEEARCVHFRSMSRSSLQEAVPDLARNDGCADEIVSKKPGHLFNAGAPIGSLAFAPRTDGPSDKGASECLSSFLLAHLHPTDAQPTTHVRPSQSTSSSRPTPRPTPSFGTRSRPRPLPPRAPPLPRPPFRPQAR